MSAKHPQIKQLINWFSTWADVGIHPSYQSYLNDDVVAFEFKTLERVLEKQVCTSRQHFLRFTLPKSYQLLIKQGVTEEYSMGYAEVIGFRAGTCTPYPFYDLSKEQPTGLKVYPLIAMDVTLHNYMKLNVSDAIDRFAAIIQEVKNVNGTFISLWHNSSFSQLHGMQDWKPVFEQMLKTTAND